MHHKKGSDASSPPGALRPARGRPRRGRRPPGSQGRRGAGSRRGRVREPGRPRRPRTEARFRPAVPRPARAAEPAGRASMSPASSSRSAPKATRFRPGDRVFADLYPHGGGAFAEYACAPEKAFQPMPAGMSFEDAATLPHSAILAIQGLRRRDGRTIKPGDKVADRRRVGQRRAVRGPDREVDGRRGDRRLQHRRRWTSSVRSAPTT